MQGVGEKNFQDVLLILYTIKVSLAVAYPGLWKTCKMEIFAALANGFYLLTIVAKYIIWDVFSNLRCASALHEIYARVYNE